MTPEQIKKYQKAAEEGTIPDAENPLFLFSTIHAKLLVMGLNREFSFTELAKRELSNRGLNTKGEWVGFDERRQRTQQRKQRGKRP